MSVTEPRVILYRWYALNHRMALSTENTCCAQMQLSDGVKMKCNVVHVVKGCHRVRPTYLQDHTGGY